MQRKREAHSRRNSNKKRTTSNINWLQRRVARSHSILNSRFIAASVCGQAIKIERLAHQSIRIVLTTTTCGWREWLMWITARRLRFSTHSGPNFVVLQCIRSTASRRTSVTRRTDIDENITRLLVNVVEQRIPLTLICTHPRYPSPHAVASAPLYSSYWMGYEDWQQARQPVYFINLKENRTTDPLRRWASHSHASLFSKFSNWIRCDL